MSRINADLPEKLGELLPCRLMAHSGRAQCADECPLLGAERTDQPLLTKSSSAAPMSWRLWYAIVLYLTPRRRENRDEHE